MNSARRFNGTLNVDDIQTGIIAGLSLINRTASTSLVPIQRSPSLLQVAHGWTGAADQVAQFREQIRPVNGTDPITAKKFWSAKIGSGSEIDVLDLSNAGALHAVASMSAPVISASSVLSADTTLFVGAGGMTQTTHLIGTGAPIGVNSVCDTAAAFNAQQYSPIVAQAGQGWKTDAVAGTLQVQFGTQVRPIQGTAAPTGKWFWSHRIDAYPGSSSWTDDMDLDTSGNLHVVGNITASGLLTSTSGEKNLKTDFGATGDGTTDDGPALRTAWQYMSTNGGTLYAPPGTYRIRTQAFCNVTGGAGSQWIMYGSGDVTKFKVDLTTTTNECMRLTANAVISDVTLRDFSIIGNGGNTQMALVGLKLEATSHTVFTLKNIVFYGIAAGTAALHINGGRPHISDSQFISCNGTTRGIVALSQCLSAEIIHNSFSDLATFVGGTSTIVSPGPYWISIDGNIAGPYSGGTLSPDTRILIDDNNFDESPSSCIFAYPFTTNYRTQHLDITRNRFHTSSTTGAHAVYCLGVDYVYSHDNWYGYAVHIADAFLLGDVTSFRSLQDKCETAQASASCIHIPTGYSVGTIYIEESEFTAIHRNNNIGVGTPPIEDHTGITNVYERVASGVRTKEHASIGTAQTVSNKLINITVAAASAQQFSPMWIQSGQGWKTTATAASQPVDFGWQVQPVQGTTAPTGNYLLSSRINTGSWVTVSTWDSVGNQTIPGNLTVTGSYIGPVTVSTTLATTNGAATFTKSDASNGSVTTLLTLAHSNSGAGTAGVGAGIVFQAGNSTPALVSGAEVDGILTTTTAGSEVGAVVLSALNGSGSMAELIRARGDIKIGINQNSPTAFIDAVQPVRTSGTPGGVLFTAGIHTGLTAAEFHNFYINDAVIQTMVGAGGTIATMRSMRIAAPTYAFSATASIITNAYTFAIDAAPTQGTGATLTNTWAFGVLAGASQFLGDVVLAPAITTTGTHSAFKFTTPADTGQTAATLNPSVLYDLTATRTFANAGSWPNQYEYQIKGGPTYKTTAATTIPIAATFAVTAAPIAFDANTTLTRAATAYFQNSTAAKNELILDFNAAGAAHTFLSLQRQGVEKGYLALNNSSDQVILKGLASGQGLRLEGPSTNGFISFEDTNGLLVNYFGNQLKLASSAPFVFTTISQSQVDEIVEINFALTNTLTLTASPAANKLRTVVFQPHIYTKASAGTVATVATVAIVDAPSVTGSLVATNKYAFWVQAGMSGFDGQIRITQPAGNTVTPANALNVIGGLHTAALVNAEVVDVDFALNRNIQWTNTGTPDNVATQRSFVVRAPTLAFSSNTGTPTFTDAATMAITAAPIVGANAAITNAMALWIQAGMARIDDATNSAAPVKGFWLRNTLTPGSNQWSTPPKIRFQGSGKLSSTVYPQLWDIWMDAEGGAADTDPLLRNGSFAIGDGTQKHIRLRSNGTLTSMAIGLFGATPAVQGAAFSINGSAQAVATALGAAAVGTDTTVTPHGFASTTEFNNFVTAVQNLQGITRSIINYIGATQGGIGISA